MSFKTLRKRIALVAVAALAVTGLSTVSANAANSAAIVVNSINLALGTATPTQGAAVGVNVGVSVPTQTLAVNTDSFDLTAAITSFPAGGQVGATAALTTVAGAAATQLAAPFNGTYVATGGTLRVQAAAATAVTANSVTATSTVGMGSFSFTPTKAGTYVLTVFQDKNQDGIIGAVDVSQSISITVAAATQLAPASTIIRMAPAATLAVTQNTTVEGNYTAALDSIPRSASVGANAAARNNIAQIQVVLLNANGTAAGNLHTVTASVTGSGLVTVDNSGTASAGANRAHSYTLTGTDNIAVVHVTTDGTVGTGTITISVTDSVSGTTTVVGTRTVTTYGSVAKLAVTTTNYSIGRAGFKTGVASTTRAAATEVGSSAAPATVTVTSGTSTTPAFIVRATDANGASVNTAAAPAIVTSNAAVVTGGTCLLDGGVTATAADTPFKSSLNGVGYYNCDFTTAAAAKSGDKATLTIRVLDPADPLGVAFLTTTFNVTVGGSVAKEVISTDKASYIPGEGMTVTITATDASGNPVFDGAASPAVTSSKTIGGTIAASIYVAGKTNTDTSKGAKTVFAPATSGDFNLIATGTDSASTPLSAKATVASPVDAQITALVAAIAKLQAAINKINKRLKR